MAGLSAQQVADLVPCPPDQVRRLDELGLLDAHREGGRFAASAVHLVRLMGAFEQAGVPLEDVARAVASGELTFPLFLPEPAALAETYDELGARLDRPPELLRRLSRELGLPPSAGDRIREEDAEVLSLIVTTLDLADEEELSRFTRLYGGSIQRLVTAGLQFFERSVRQRLESYDVPPEETASITYKKAGEYTTLVASIVPWLQRRHREHALIEYLVGVTEELMEERGIRAVPPRQPPAIAFLDLTGYTELAEQRGDEAAADLATALAGVVNRTAQEHGGRPVKWLGDGVMFHFPDSGGAVLGGLHLLEQTEQSVRVPARIGINAGALVQQEGDFFGRTVNVAARIADYAKPHEVLVSEEARSGADVDGVEFELVGDVELKGVSRAVRLHRASRG
ncbi:MAG TPA: adenylate/guanylate cyclase domain-containing protein [Gaiellaceae bacterium]|nr:adenylate/guanylate cyclase domain-containing protein [Gaiellaceae bacterium]